MVISLMVISLWFTERLLEEVTRSSSKHYCFFESMAPFVHCLKYYFYKCSTALKKVFSDTFHILDQSLCMFFWSGPNPLRLFVAEECGYILSTSSGSPRFPQDGSAALFSVFCCSIIGTSRSACLLPAWNSLCLM